MNKRMSTNCPNCGGELTYEGYCTYCNTKVRYTNEVILDLQNALGCPDVEIMISVKKGEETLLIPFKGIVESFHQDFETFDICYDGKVIPFRDNKPKISITFSGYVQDVSDTVVKETVK